MISIKNNLKRANAARIIFYLLVTISIISLYSLFLQYQLLSEVKNGSHITQEVANANDFRQAIISKINVCLLLISSVLFLMWIYRAYDNLYKLISDKLSCTPGWAVGYWFVPIISLFKPYTVMKEIWNETQAYILSEEQKQNTAKAYLIGLWWTLYLLSIFASYFVVLFFNDKTSIDGLISLTVALMCSTVFMIIVKVVTLIMINKIAIFEKSLWDFISNRSDQQFSESTLNDASVNVPGI